jgi:hypothetical protein
MSLGTPPLNSRIPVYAEGQKLVIGYATWPTPWANYMTATWQLAYDVQNSGTTANRPTTALYTGKFYFDTTLGLPIWWEGPGWVKADGTAA